jgi:hypothetical protein
MTDELKKPTTLWELMDGVCEAIDAAPFNYNQAYWVVDAKKGFMSCVNEYDTPLPKEVCGTAYCRAGWMAMLSGSDEVSLTPGQNNIYEWASDKLKQAGIPMEDILELFSGGAVGGTPGTPEYVAAGIAGVRTFMAKHEQKLKSTQL